MTRPHPHYRMMYFSKEKLRNPEDVLDYLEDSLRHILILKVIIMVLCLAALIVGLWSRQWWMIPVGIGGALASVLTEPPWISNRE